MCPRCTRSASAAPGTPAQHRPAAGIVDIYLPDFKVWTPEAARRHLDREEYLRAIQLARELGLRLDVRSLATTPTPPPGQRNR
ncbi:MAG TPA: hypothetical protein VFA45_08220 [Actinomycetes bacterium]|nr:hypothetical protein [Actinomycetes bacterium]